MPIDSAPVGANQRQIVIVGDLTNASYQQSVVPASGDAKNIGGQYAALIAAISLLQNTSGSLDLARSAPGTVGIPSVNSEGTKATYSSAILGYTPYATATDMWVLVGSGTKTVRLTRLTVSGFATAAATVDVQLIKRTAVNTGGTASQPAIAPHDSNDAAASAVINLYSVIPSGLGAGIAVRAGKLNLGAAGSAGVIEWTFGNRNSKASLLRGVAQGLALNFNGQVVPSGTSLDIDCEYTEE